MEIRRLTISDLGSAAALLGRFKKRVAEPESLKKYLNSDETYLIGAFDESDPVGIAIAYLLPRGDTARPMMYLHDIEVARSHRRKGIARRMIQLLLEECRRHKAYKMFVITAWSNQAAVRLYEATSGRRLPDSDSVFEYQI